MLLQAKGVTHYFGGLCAVSDFNLDLEEGELVGIIGPNGAGKTTVFNLITGVYRSTEGSIQFANAELVGMKSNRVTVRNMLVAPKEKPVKFEYVLGQASGQWVIINIVVDGISDLALKKAQYTSVIDREGFDSLMNKLTQKITDYASKNTSSG